MTRYDTEPDPLVPRNINATTPGQWDTLKTQPDGWSSSYYEIPPDAQEIDDLIIHKDMDWHRANIFKAAYRWGQKEGTSVEYDLNKIIWMAERAKRAHPDP